MLQSLLLSKIPDLDEPYLVFYCINGLKEDIQLAVKLFWPSSVQGVFSIANIMEFVLATDDRKNSTFSPSLAGIPSTQTITVSATISASTVNNNMLEYVPPSCTSSVINNMNVTTSTIASTFPKIEVQSSIKILSPKVLYQGLHQEVDDDVVGEVHTVATETKDTVLVYSAEQLENYANTEDGCSSVIESVIATESRKSAGTVKSSVSSSTLSLSIISIDKNVDGNTCLISTDTVVADGSFTPNSCYISYVFTKGNNDLDILHSQQVSRVMIAKSPMPCEGIPITVTAETSMSCALENAKADSLAGLTIQSHRPFFVMGTVIVGKPVHNLMASSAKQVSYAPVVGSLSATLCDNKVVKVCISMANSENIVSHNSLGAPKGYVGLLGNAFAYNPWASGLCFSNSMDLCSLGSSGWPPPAIVSNSLFQSDIKARLHLLTALQKCSLRWPSDGAKIATASAKDICAYSVLNCNKVEVFPCVILVLTKFEVPMAIEMKQPSKILLSYGALLKVGFAVVSLEDLLIVARLKGWIIVNVRAPWICFQVKTFHELILPFLSPRPLQQHHCHLCKCNLHSPLQLKFQFMQHIKAILQVFLVVPVVS